MRQTSAVTDSCHLYQIALNSLNEYTIIVNVSGDLDGCGVILWRKQQEHYTCELQYKKYVAKNVTTAEHFWSKFGIIYFDHYWQFFFFFLVSSGCLES